MRGTLINTSTVLAGGTLGFLVGGRFPSGMRALLMNAIGLVTLVIGLQRALATANVLVLLTSAVVGGALGEVLRIERGLERLGELAQLALAGQLGRASAGQGETPSNEGTVSSISRGFVTASLIFCVGPMTILGSLEDGLSGSYQTLALKATLDGVTSVVLASTLGWGVILAAGTVLIFQGALTLGAGVARGALTEPIIVETTAVGGLLILAIGLNILELTRVRVGNLLPALVVAPALAALWGARGG